MVGTEGPGMDTGLRMDTGMGSEGSGMDTRVGNEGPGLDLQVGSEGSGMDLGLGLDPWTGSDGAGAGHSGGQ